MFKILMRKEEGKVVISSLTIVIIHIKEVIIMKDNCMRKINRNLKLLKMINKRNIINLFSKVKTNKQKVQSRICLICRQVKVIYHKFRPHKYQINKNDPLISQVKVIINKYHKIYIITFLKWINKKMMISQNLSNSIKIIVLLIKRTKRNGYS